MSAIDEDINCGVMVVRVAMAPVHPILQNTANVAAERNNVLVFFAARTSRGNDPLAKKGLLSMESQVLLMEAVPQSGNIFYVPDLPIVKPPIESAIFSEAVPTKPSAITHDSPRSGVLCLRPYEGDIKTYNIVGGFDSSQSVVKETLSPKVEMMLSRTPYLLESVLH